MIRLLVLALLLLTAAPAAALDLYGVYSSQATMGTTPPPPDLTIFTLNGAPRTVTVLLNGSAMAVGPLADPTGATAVPGGTCLDKMLVPSMGWDMIRCKLLRPMEAGEVLTVVADDKRQQYRVTYGEYQSYGGLIRMWGLQRL